MPGTIEPAYELWLNDDSGLIPHPAGEADHGVEDIDELEIQADYYDDGEEPY